MSPGLPMPEVAEVAEVLGAPARVGTEMRWSVQLKDGTRGVLAQLLPELAVDASIRRRWVRDVEALRGAAVQGVAPILATGPTPDPRDTAAPPPWRLRADPPGETLEAWLRRRAPAGVNEVARIVAALARVVHAVHATGGVLRDLHPRGVVLTDAGPMLTDVGLARVDLLSTRTAASLILEGSPYASPEQLRRTTLDQRSDLYGLGVIAFRALTGLMPRGDQPALLRESGPAPAPSSVVPEIPPALDEVVRRCLDDDPEGRPESALDLARVLEGEGDPGGRERRRVECQACGAGLRPGQRLCLHCGREAVQFKPGGGSVRLVLKRVSEEGDNLARLRSLLGAVSDRPLPPLNFMVGDRRMYSKRERKRRIALPATLFDTLDEATAVRLETRMKNAGFQVTRRGDGGSGLSRGQRIATGVTVALVVAAIIGMAAASVATGTMAAVAVAMGVAGLLMFLIMRAQAKRRKRPSRPLLQLRSAPAALPASDPLVARLSALIDPAGAADLHEQVGELALIVQRLVDHRSAIEARAEGEEIAAVTEPVDRLVGLVEAVVREIAGLDVELRELDEGVMVRALAGAEVRHDEVARDRLLTGLDRLRALEESRARGFHRLLEASSLLRRSVELGLSVHDPQREHERSVALALVALEGETAPS